MSPTPKKPLLDPSLAADVARFMAADPRERHSMFLDEPYRLIDLLAFAEHRSQERYQWILDLQSHTYVTCVYCGHRYGPDPGTPTSHADLLKEHIEQCPEHPMSALKWENERLKIQIDDLRKENGC